MTQDTNTAECTHGSLARACAVCERDDTIAELTKNRDWWKAQAMTSEQIALDNRKRAETAEANFAEQYGTEIAVLTGRIAELTKARDERFAVARAALDERDAEITGLRERLATGWEWRDALLVSLQAEVGRLRGVVDAAIELRAYILRGRAFIGTSHNAKQGQPIIARFETAVDQLREARATQNQEERDDR